MKIYKRILVFSFSLLTAFLLINCSTEDIIGNNSVSPSAVRICASPEFSVEGGEYDSRFTTLVSTATPESVVYYTTDGSNPKTSADAIAVIAPFNLEINESSTIKAYVKRSGYIDSNTVTINYTIDSSSPRVSAPIVEILDPDDDDGFFTIRLYCTTPGSTIKYTYNGEDPHTSTSTMAVGAAGTSVTLAQGTTVKAYAIKAGMTESGMTIRVLN